MTFKLLMQTLFKIITGFILLAALLFIPAGTFKYWNAWILIGALFIPMIIVGIILMIKSPERLKERLNSNETESKQKLVVLLSALMFIGGFILAGLNFRYNWHEISNITVYISTFIFLFSFLMYAEVLRENMFLSRVIKVQENHKVVDTGLYGIVRHPMYTSTIIMFLTMPLILGSLISFVIFLVYPFIIAIRIKNEEDYLEKELEGYKEYKEKVKYKIIPFIW